jgi:hypothetical protein
MYKIYIFLHFIIPSFGLVTYGTDLKYQELPEYSEYLKKLGLITTTTTMGNMLNTTRPDYSRKLAMIQKTTTGMPAVTSGAQRIDTFAPLPQFPLVEICKHSPTDIYGYVICWSLLALYLMLIASLIIYQLRSYFWLRNRRHHIGWSSHGQYNNSKNTSIKSTDEQGIQGMFPM